ncbi:hypothetical protein DIPPA_33911 [Diplonema papillatum]|nr:hypothetical protein DIPPA_33911 [Diplonema papillatum]
MSLRWVRPSIFRTNRKRRPREPLDESQEARVPDREETKIEAIAAGREQLDARSGNGMSDIFPATDPETDSTARKVCAAKASRNKT